MKKYIAYINETGSFSYLDKSRNCFIGGWVCQWEPTIKKQLETFLSIQAQQFNATTGEHLNYPSDMHFMPMHTPHHQKNAKDRHIKIDPENAPLFFKKVFNELKNKTLMVFRSAGMPVIIPHEQAAYMEILRNTLVQLVNDEFFPEEFSLKIIIARRRQDILYGYRGAEDPDAYEQYLARSLMSEINDSSPRASQLDIHIGFGKATGYPGLMIADFFCGALKYKKSAYLSEYRDIKKIYQFNAGFKWTTLSVKQRIDHLGSLDPIAAFMQAAQIYSGTGSKAIRSEMQKIYKSLSPPETKQLFSVTREYLDTLLRERPERYDNLDEADSFIQVLSSFLPSSPEQMNREELCIKATLDLQAIRIASHRGKISDHVVQNHIVFLDRFSSHIFANRMEYIQHIIDASLMAVQVQAFNPLKFDEAEQNIKPVRDRYEAMFEPEFSSNSGMIDENRARLEGTYGQMCGFLHNLTGEEHYFLQAEKSLKNDIAACRPGGSVWEQ